MDQVDERLDVFLSVFADVVVAAGRVVSAFADVVVAVFERWRAWLAANPSVELELCRLLLVQRLDERFVVAEACLDDRVDASLTLAELRDRAGWSVGWVL